MKPGKGLGKGLEALLGDFANESGEPIQADIHLLDPNSKQARKQFDQEKLEELANSIRQHGIIQPLIVQRNGERYRIVAGERRYRAARLLGLKEVPVIVRDYDDRMLMEVSLIENIQRDNLNPVEEAAAIQLLMQQHDFTQEEVSDRLGKSRPTVANSLRLLGLPEEILQLLREGKLASGHARAILSVPSDERIGLARLAVTRGMSVRELEKRTQKKEKAAPKVERQLPELSAVEDTLRAHLKTRVKLQGNDRTGKIIIEYFTGEELERIYALLIGEDAL